jgi:glyoxylase-like metal-dependent hydrolase (beta-lactamase superfamily II)
MAGSQITIGKVRITGLSDAVLAHPLTLDRLFPSVPAEAWEGYRQGYPDAFVGSSAWRVNVGCYLLRSSGKTILVDAGIGAAGGEIANSLRVPSGGRLLEKLQSLSLRPEDVDVVFLTHLHRDHVGWNVVQEDGQRRLTFPRARYIVHQADWEAFHRPEVQAAWSLTHLEQAVTPLQSLGGLELISGELNITDEVMAVHTPGHTPGHMSVLVLSRARSAVITGDVIVHPAQVANADCAFGFDMDVQEARQTRHRLLEQIEAEGMAVFGGHFPKRGYGRLVREDGRRYWQAL